MTLVAGELETDSQLIESARRLYCGLLNGRHLAATRHAYADRVLRFLVGGVVVETGFGHRARSGRIRLRLEEPETVAARCWNAGYTVLVDDGVAESHVAALAVIDPFGLRIDLDRAASANVGRAVPAIG